MEAARRARGDRRRRRRAPRREPRTVRGRRAARRVRGGGHRGDHGREGGARRTPGGDTRPSRSRSTTAAPSPATSSSSRSVGAPNTDDLGVDTVGLEPGKAVEVDDQLRATGVPGGWLYAVGDVNGRVLLTHMGKYQARIAADVILKGSTPRGVGRPPRGARASCSRIRSWRRSGSPKREAREQGIDVRVVRYRNRRRLGRQGARPGYHRHQPVVVDEARRVVVGATFTGPGVGEMLHTATIAVAGEVPARRAVARGAHVPDDQRGLAPPPGGVRARPIRYAGKAALVPRAYGRGPRMPADHRNP